MREKELNGKKLAKDIKNQLKHKIEHFTKEACYSPKLAIVYVGEDPASAAYVRSKEKTCKKLGIETELFHYPETLSMKSLRKELSKLNDDNSVHGIIIEMPLPDHIPFTQAAAAIDPVKDVDGLHPNNIGWVVSGNPYYIPNTPMAVMKLLEAYNIPLEGKEAVIVGRSLPVGKPLIQLLLSQNATVTVCHTRTRDLSFHTSRADVLIVSAGKPSLIKGSMIKEGAVVIDVGINVTETGITGDVDYEDVYPKASYITPVPGGVGPLTVAMIVENTLNAAIVQEESRMARKNPIPIEPPQCCKK